jgi:hypothetical protein
MEALHLAAQAHQKRRPFGSPFFLARKIRG